LHDAPFGPGVVPQTLPVHTAFLHGSAAAWQSESPRHSTHTPRPTQWGVVPTQGEACSCWPSAEHVWLVEPSRHEVVPATQTSHCLPAASHSSGWHCATLSNPSWAALHFSSTASEVQRCWSGAQTVLVQAPAPALQ
jgi:hypothetical protein